MLWVVCLLGLSLAGCDNGPIEPECAPLSVNFVPSPNQELFIDLAYGQEFGAQSEGLRKWNEPIRIFVEGVPDSETLQEIDTVVAELAALSPWLVVERVPSEDLANLRFYVGRKENYVAVVEPAAMGIAEGNSGFVTIAWNDQFEIIRASVCLDILNFPDRTLHKHIIREELAQALGLINDTELDGSSIFHQFFDNAIAYTSTDSLMIQYMLGDRLEPGMCVSEAMDVVE